MHSAVSTGIHFFMLVVLYFALQNEKYGMNLAFFIITISYQGCFLLIVGSFLLKLFSLSSNIGVKSYIALQELPVF